MVEVFGQVYFHTEGFCREEIYNAIQRAKHICNSYKVAVFCAEI